MKRVDGIYGECHRGNANPSFKADIAFYVYMDTRSEAPRRL